MNNLVRQKGHCLGNSIDLYADTNGMLVEQFTMTFDSPFSYSTINTNLPGSYYIKVSGVYTATGMPLNRDGAFNIFKSDSLWFCSDIREISGIMVLIFVFYQKKGRKNRPFKESNSN